MNKNNIIIIVAVILILIAFAAFGSNTTVQIIMLLVALLALLYTRRSTMYFARANKAYTAKKGDYIQFYNKAVKAGLAYKYMVIAGTILIKEGAVEDGKNALCRIINDRHFRDDKIISQARIALSMGYYQEKDYSKAAEICEEVMKSDYRDKNLYINLSTYLLALGRLDDFYILVDEFSSKSKLSTPALADLQVTRCILQGDFIKAYQMLVYFMKQYTFNFADPYVHFAQVYMHYGEAEKAVEVLKECLAKVLFEPIYIIPKEVIRQLIEELSDPDRAPALMAANNADPLALINGHMPQPYSGEIIFASFSEVEEAEKQEEIEKRRQKSLIERDHSTDLTDEDEQWLKRHQDS